MERGGEDRDRAYGDAIACVMVGVHSVIELPNRGWLEALADGEGMGMRHEDNVQLTIGTRLFAPTGRFSLA